MLSFLISPFFRLFHVILGLGTQQNFPPPLDAAEEDVTFRLARTHPDPARRASAREKLILHNLRLVSHIVRKYYASSRDQEDLISIGTIGLCKAVDTFRPETGTRFATYGAKCIQNEILMYFRAQKKVGPEVSLSDTIDVDRDGNPLTYMDVISSEENLTEEILRKIDAERALNFVRTRLEPRERQIIILRFGIDGHPAMTQREIALNLRISRSYVSRIEKAAIEKLRDAFGLPPQGQYAGQPDAG